MSKTFQVLLVIALACFMLMTWGLSQALEYERTKPVYLEAAADRNGDVHVRIQGEDMGATFKGLCKRGINL